MEISSIFLCCESPGTVSARTSHVMPSTRQAPEPQVLIHFPLLECHASPCGPHHIRSCSKELRLASHSSVSTLKTTEIQWVMCMVCESYLNEVVK